MREALATDCETCAMGYNLYSTISYHACLSERQSEFYSIVFYLLLSNCLREAVVTNYSDSNFVKLWARKKTGNSDNRAAGAIFFGGGGRKISFRLPTSQGR